MIQPTESRAKRIAVGIIAVGIIVPGAFGFINKLVEFFRTLRLEEGGGFTIIPIANYFLVAAGMACLLVWAIAHGMFRNIEGPKYTLLEHEAELDRRAGRPWSD